MRKALIQRRKQLGYTQRDLAQMVGCTFVNISQVENGKSGASLDMAIKLSRALGYAIDPTGRISTAFDFVGALNVKQARQMADAFGVPFDTENLFEVI